MIADGNYGDADLISLHQYACCDASHTATEWSLLRHRKIHDYLVSIGRGNHPNFVITEGGIDRCSGCPNRGWTTCGWSAERMAQWCKYADTEMSKDSYVAGYVTFTNAPNDEWRAFDMDSVVDYIVDGSDPPPTARAHIPTTSPAVVTAR